MGDGARTAKAAEDIPRIRDKDAYGRNQWDLDIFSGCFGPTIKAGDVDGHVEKNGSHLWIEFKAPGGDLPIGQDIALRALSSRPRMFVFVVRGERNHPEEYAIWGPDGPRRWIPCDLASLRQRMSAWYTWACRKGWEF